MKGRIVGAALALALVCFVVPSCSNPESLGKGYEGGGPSGFATSDAGADGDVDASVLAPAGMCPVTTCTLPWATCASSEFPCDVNLLTDDDNCGGCGIRCGGEQKFLNSKWSCVDGQCAFGCVAATGAGYRDCDKDPGNGCEVGVIGGNVDNCGDCGIKCAPGLDCINGICVDECASRGYPDTCDGECANKATDDYNCGACGAVCDRAGPGLPALPEDMYYGCVGGECGKAKCSGFSKADCNHDVRDGCEVSLNTDANCKSCGDACAVGKSCGDLGNGFRCLCDGGETYCGRFFQCKNLNDDIFHCGGCNFACPGVGLPHFLPSCSLGICGGKCEDGHADCDGARANGCEINIRVDTRNCGGCGNACLPNQVCSEGKCLVAPCEPGKPTTK